MSNLNLNEAARFLKAINPDQSAKFNFQTFMDQKISKENRNAEILCRKATKTFYGTLDEHHSSLNKLNKFGAGIFVGINQMHNKKRGKSNVKSIQSYYIEKDDGMEIKEFHLKPSIVIQSARGQHIYWLASSGHPVDSYENIQKKLISHYRSDPGVFGRERVMRLPGSFHLKDKSNPFYIEIKELNDKRYSIEELQKNLQVNESNQESDSHRKTKKFSNVNEGNRNSTITSICGSLKSKGLSQEATLSALLQENAIRCIPPLEDEEVRRIVESIFNYDEPIVSYAFNDLGRAEGFIEHFKDQLHFVPEIGKWCFFNGTYWEQLPSQQILQKAKKFAKHRKALIDSFPDKDSQLYSNLIGDYNRLVSKSGITAYLTLAESEALKEKRSFDTFHSYLCVKNGVVNLKTGDIKKHHPNYFFTKSIDIEYFKEKRSPHFEKFINSIFSNDQGIINYIQKACGYSLTGENNEQCLFVLYGLGSNGKSTFLEIIRYILNDYVKNADIKTFIASKSDKIRNDLARLSEARLVTSVETNEGAILDESLIKSMTGGDPITARFLHKEYFDFIPRFKIWMAVNHKPHINGVDRGIWRRIKLIPFLNQFEGKNADKNLLEKLKSESEGILAWMIQGAIKWYKEGLVLPTAIQQASQEYQDEENYFKIFVEERCILDSDEWISTNDLIQAYSFWAENTVYPKLSYKTLASRMREIGATTKKRNGKRGYLGIRLVQVKEY